jgi:general secretion pathway protein K
MQVETPHDVGASTQFRVRSAGFVIIAALWILAALATLVIMYSVYVRDTALEFVNHDERLQAEALASSGVELAAYQLTKNPNVRPSGGQFTFAQGSATINVAFRSENSRIDLNFASKELLAGLLSSLGVERDEALTFADHIVAWRTPLKSGQSDPEAELYQAAGKNYGPRHGPFQHPNELALVADLPPTLIDRILPYVTVYSGRPQVNVLVAAPQVLAALPGMSPERLQLLLRLREAGPQTLTSAQMGGLSDITMDASRANRVSINIRFRSGRLMYTQVVILLTDDTEPYRIVSWSIKEP